MQTPERKPRHLVVPLAPKKADQELEQEDGIDLGSMRIVDGKWSRGECYCEETMLDGDEHCSVCILNLNPIEIVIPKKEISIVYSYPLTNKFTKIHSTNNFKGFSRKEISQQIMETYSQIYKEEREDIEHHKNGRYGIFRHGITDLILHSLVKENANTFSCGIDS